MLKKTIRDIDLDGKRVLLRTDYNVQIDEGGILDDRRLRESIPTIEYLRDHGAKVIILSHRGRPHGAVVEGLRNAPVAGYLAQLLGTPVGAAEDCVGPAAHAAIGAMRNGDVLLLENVRFHEEEEANDPEFGAQLASLGDIYVDDAFGTAHRAHATIVGIAQHLPAVAGFLMEKEVEHLGEVTENPDRPFGIVLGGAKMSDKIQILEHLLDHTDVVCIGGGMANTFLAAQGIDVARSLLEQDRIDMARSILERAAQRSDLKFILPTDVVVSIGNPENGNVATVPVGDVPSGWRILDIGPATVEAFREALNTCRTVVWNGPMGLFEQARFANGSLEVARIFAKLDATTIVGGGETAAVVRQAGVESHISHISTGGGASLEMLEGKSLPGVQVLLDA
ncbi:MAG: phosphoglycerate kinase [Dehalococcoidia bacterium]